MIHPIAFGHNTRFSILPAGLIVLGILLSSTGICQQAVKEPSTEKLFPAEVKVGQPGKEITLKCTGVAVRKKFIFKVYGIAHYMEEPVKVNDPNKAFNAILTDGKAKQIVMDFARDVDITKIKEAYMDGVKEHATSAEFQQIQPMLNQFLGYFSKDVKENEKFILRWFPGGIISANTQGEEKSPIVNGTFARVLWSIWFGNDSIVDREKLIELMITH
jgi:hypothetical protein